MKKTLITAVSIILLASAFILCFSGCAPSPYKDGIYSYHHYSAKDGWSYTGYKVSISPGSQTSITIPTEGKRGIAVQEVYIGHNSLTTVTIPEGIVWVNIDLGENIRHIEISSTVKSFVLRVDDTDEYYEQGFVAYESLESITYNGTIEKFQKIFSYDEKLPAGIEVSCSDGTFITEGMPPVE